MRATSIKKAAITSLALFGLWYLASQTLLGIKIQEYLKPIPLLEAESVGGGATYAAESAFAYIKSR